MIEAKDIERRLVSTILAFSSETLSIASNLVSGSDFFDEQFGAIFDSARELYFSRGTVDIVELSRRLKSKGVTAFQIGELIRDATTTIFVEEDSMAVEESARRRKLASVFDRASASIQNGESNISEATDEVVRQIAELGTGRVSNLTHIGPVLEGIVARLKRAADGDIDRSAVATGIRSLDIAMGGGLRPSELIVLAARPGLGKTALAVNIADFVSRVCGRTTLFVSLEMTQQEIAERFLAKQSRVRGLRIRKLSISGDESQIIDLSVPKVASSKLFIDDSPSMTMNGIESAARRLAGNSGLDLIVVDYLQLITASNNRSSRAEQVTEISRRLKIMARLLKVPVLCLAQLNRQSEAGGDKRPKKSQLRESGSIEQDADSVLLLHREDDDSPLNTLIVDKNRHGPCCDIPLLVQPSCFRFEEAVNQGSTY